MLLTLLLSAAQASPGYPSQVETDVGMPCVPTCTLCHTTNAGGTGTITSDFGLAMLDRGLAGGSDSDGLIAALDAMDADGVDSDGDGTADLDELAEGNDPNPGGVAFCDLVTPEYGCFNTAALPASLLGALAGLVAARRRRSG